MYNYSIKIFSCKIIKNHIIQKYERNIWNKNDNDKKWYKFDFTYITDISSKYKFFICNLLQFIYNFY